MQTSTVHLRSSEVEYDLVLPRGSDDPVVSAYLHGEAINEPLVELLHQVLPAPSTVLDLGCHVGTFSIAAAALGHRVVSVDASAMHTVLVRASAEANGFDRVTVIHSAVSNRRGTVRFSEQGLFGAVVHGADGVEVKADTPPALLAEADCAVEEIGFIKMDIEGSELRALEGSEDWLSGPSAPPILYESNPGTAAPFGYSIEGMRLALEEFGYRSYRPEPDGLFLCPPREPQPEAWVDLLALKDPHGIQVREPISSARLLQKFNAWSRDPDPQIRGYTKQVIAALPLRQRLALRLGGLLL
jgi:FkbM family methyltransferase